MENTVVPVLASNPAWRRERERARAEQMRTKAKKMVEALIALPLAEVKNHLGDTEYQTYQGWRAACKKAHPACTFRGDKDIGGAVVDGKDIGEWGGDVGSVFKAKPKKVSESTLDPEDAAAIAQRFGLDFEADNLVGDLEQANAYAQQGRDAEALFSGYCQDRAAEQRSDREYNRMIGDEDGDSEFADSGGNSALRAATDDDPRVHACPNCGGGNLLTLADLSRGYQCDRCANKAEQGVD